MSDNIFGHIFKARSLAFQTDEQGETEAFKRRVWQEIEGNITCSHPKFIMFKATNKCNSRCVYCDYSVKNRYSNGFHEKNGKNRIEYEDFTRIIDESGELGIYAIAFNGGEPLLHKDIVRIIAYSNGRKVLPILMTNGLLLPAKWESLGEAGLKYIMISLDSLNEDVFMAHRGVSLKKTMDGVNAAIKMREKYGWIVIHLTAVLTKHNIGEMVLLAEFCKKNDIWLEVCAYHHTSSDVDVLSVNDEKKCKEAIKQLLLYKEQGYPISTSIEYLEHIYDFFINKKKKPDRYQCMVGYTTLQIDGHLNARPCWSSTFRMLGNLKASSIKEIWCSEEMKRYRKMMLRGYCSGCWNMCNEVTALVNEVSL